MVETTFNGASFKSRIIFLSSVIIIEPTVFGSEFLDATDEEVIDKRRILRVDLLLPDLSEMTEAEIQDARAKCLSLEVTLQDTVRPPKRSASSKHQSLVLEVALHVTSLRARCVVDCTLHRAQRTHPMSRTSFVCVVDSCRECACM